MKRKIWLILFLLPMLVLAFPKTSLAQSEAMIQFRLHKLIGTNEQSENIGILNNEQGINGASFAVYDVTNAFYQLREKGFDLEEAQQIIARQGTPAGDFIMEKITRELSITKKVWRSLIYLKKNRKKIKCIYSLKRVKGYLIQILPKIWL